MIRGAYFLPVVAIFYLFIQYIGAGVLAASDRYSQLRLRMVETQIRARGISDARVLSVMGKVPRHEFVPKAYRGSAYVDDPLPIGHGQTISQPYIKKQRLIPVRFVPMVKKGK